MLAGVNQVGVINAIKFEQRRQGDAITFGDLAQRIARAHE